MSCVRSSQPLCATSSFPVMRRDRPRQKVRAAVALRTLDSPSASVLMIPPERLRERLFVSLVCVSASASCSVILSVSNHGDHHDVRHGTASSLGADPTRRGRPLARTGCGSLGCSEGQFRRLPLKFRTSGPAGLVHGNLGRACERLVRDDVRDRVVAPAGGRYAGSNETHLYELLAERKGIELSRSNVRRILRAQAIASPRRREGAGCHSACPDPSDRRRRRPCAWTRPSPVYVVVTAVGLKQIRRREGQLLCPHAAGSWSRSSCQPAP
jgi:hypothetical protein